MNGFAEKAQRRVLITVSYHVRQWGIRSLALLEE